MTRIISCELMNTEKFFLLLFNELYLRNQFPQHIVLNELLDLLELHRFIVLIDSYF